MTDGKLIWVNFGSRGLYCLDMKGNIKWENDLGKMNIRASFGEGSSPSLAGENLIVVADHEGDSFIIALNKKTGKLLTINELKELGEEFDKVRDKISVDEFMEKHIKPIPAKDRGKYE